MERKRTYGVWAVRSSTSIFGPAQSWCKENGKPLEFDSKADAENYAKEANEHTAIKHFTLWIETKVLSVRYCKSLLTRQKFGNSVK